MGLDDRTPFGAPERLPKPLHSATPRGNRRHRRRRGGCRRRRLRHAPARGAVGAREPSRRRGSVLRDLVIQYSALSLMGTRLHRRRQKNKTCKNTSSRCNLRVPLVLLYTGSSTAAKSLFSSQRLVLDSFLCSSFDSFASCEFASSTTTARICVSLQSVS